MGEEAPTVPKRWSDLVGYLKEIASLGDLSAQDVDAIVQAVSATEKNFVLVDVADFANLRKAVKDS